MNSSQRFNARAKTSKPTKATKKPKANPFAEQIAAAVRAKFGEAESGLRKDVGIARAETAGGGAIDQAYNSYRNSLQALSQQQAALGSQSTQAMQSIAAAGAGQLAARGGDNAAGLAAGLTANIAQMGAGVAGAAGADTAYRRTQAVQADLLKAQSLQQRQAEANTLADKLRSLLQDKGDYAMQVGGELQKRAFDEDLAVKAYNLQRSKAEADENLRTRQQNLAEVVAKWTQDDRLADNRREDRLATNTITDSRAKRAEAKVKLRQEWQKIRQDARKLAAESAADSKSGAAGLSRSDRAKWEKAVAQQTGIARVIKRLALSRDFENTSQLYDAVKSITGREVTPTTFRIGLDRAINPGGKLGRTTRAQFAGMLPGGKLPKGW